MQIKFIIAIAALFLIRNSAVSQIPVEVYAGHERITADIMFFKFFTKQHKDSVGRPNRWLFFNRNRASVDYRMTKTKYLPQFGFTEAISYNHEKLKGFAPVLVTQILSWGVLSKAGIQYASIKKETTLFTWLICETLKKPSIDYFLLFRYIPKLSAIINLFTQLESLSTFPTTGISNYSFTQRVRIGVQWQHWQLGVGSDFNQAGRSTFTKTYNAGCFIRHEF